jgi:hypothetical protein
VLLGGNQQQEKRHYGIYRGVCLDNKDPEKRRRIKVKVPQLFGEEVIDWAWPCLPPSAYQIHPNHIITVGSGGDPSHSHSVTIAREATTDPRDVGNKQHTPHWNVPKIKEGVWVMFEGGDPDYPVWMGVF